MRLEAVRDYPLAFTADLAETSARPDEWWIDLLARDGGDGTQRRSWSPTQGAGRARGHDRLFTPSQPKLAHAGNDLGRLRPVRRTAVAGIGEQLLRACIDWAARRSLVTVKLSVVAGNDVARRCYERVGFTAYGVEPLAVQWEGGFTTRR
jgi:GNAT superfamily N-acetyltransferase